MLGQALGKKERSRDMVRIERSKASPLRLILEGHTTNLQPRLRVFEGVVLT